MTAAVIESVSALRDRVLDATQRKATLRIAGQGTWLDAGHPARCSETVSVRELSGITQYVPGDLTLTAGAGTTLAEIRDATSVHGQWLALDPHGADHGTLGATVATASTGPLTAAFGAPRDLVLGVEFILGTGVVARGGGRVVKNVAGFDLTRLLTGSWGTLGILTEITVRLHAAPTVDESFAIPLDAAGAAGRVRRALRGLPFTPYACEIINDTLAALLVGSAKTTGLFRLAGNPDAVRAQRVALGELGEAREIGGNVWQRLRQSEPDRAVVFRMSRASSDVDRTWSEAAALTASCPGALLAASPARGVVRCVVPASEQALHALSRALNELAGAACIGERLPAELWPLMPSVPMDPVSAGIKRTFDPHGVLNAGVLFGDGA